MKAVWRAGAGLGAALKTLPPVAALRIPLKQKGGIVQFPLAFEVTSRDLLFPLTPEAWITDARNKGEMGIAATIDSDGKIATGDTKDLIGFGISKPVPIGEPAKIPRPERRMGAGPMHTDADYALASVGTAAPAKLAASERDVQICYTIRNADTHCVS